MTDRIRLATMAIGFFLATIAIPGPAPAQLLGANTLGDYGLMSATQPDPGFYLAGVYYRYDGERFRDRDGNIIAIDPDQEGELDANGYSLGGWYVTKAKLFGGNYGFMIFPGLTNNALEAPILGLTSKSGTGFADLYVQPINLGWHTERADFLAGLGVYIPTGRYSAGGSDNLGMGMWSFEILAGTTLYLDKARSWNFATTAYFETHTEKKDTDQKVGNILTLEGGLGKSFMGGGLNVGVAYYAQWKLSADQLGQEIEDEFAALGRPLPANHRGFGVGPELTLPIATKKSLIATVTARYLWETGVRTSLEGRTFVAQVTFPIPSISLQ